jgi:hypothetical protein
MLRAFFLKGEGFLSSLSTDVTAAAAIEAQIAALEAQLDDKRTLRDAQFKALWDKVKRTRNSIKGSFGDDSAQYKMVGGTRLSERKPVRRQSQSAE